MSTNGPSGKADSAAAASAGRCLRAARAVERRLRRLKQSAVARQQPITGRRVVLLAVVCLMTSAAAFAIAILLFGDFGSTETRILATTALLAGYGLLTLPAALLRDQRRAPAASAAVAALSVAAATLAMAVIWSDDAPEAIGKALGTANAWLIAAVQPAALMLRQRERDPRAVRLLFTGSSALVSVLALMFTVLLWAEIESEQYGRIFGALLVLDVLLVALQPILARVRPHATVHTLRIRVATGESVDVSVEAPDLGNAAAKAIRAVESEGERVLGLDVTGAGTERATAGPRPADLP